MAIVVVTDEVSNIVLEETPEIRPALAPTQSGSVTVPQCECTGFNTQYTVSINSERYGCEELYLVILISWYRTVSYK